MTGSSELPRATPPAAKAVTLNLPPDILAALDRYSQQSGQSQSQLLIAALRKGLGLSRKSTATQEEVAQLEARLAALESLPERVDQLEAQIDRLLRAQPSSALPEINEPFSEETLELPGPELLDTCPKCDRPLGPPLKASGRQVCAKCGWSDKPRTEKLRSDRVDADLAPDVLRQLLDQAAADALTNMKPKSKQNPDTPPKRFLGFGR